MLKSKLNVSIVIPVYNEEDHLAACLEALARQTVAPCEVIVVDNNSTDNTVAVAQQFSFVIVRHEPRQGVVYARDSGFAQARGEIIGRLDADSIVPPDWVATVQAVFEADNDLAAVTGKVTYYGIAASWLIDGIDLWIRKRMARLLGREVALQGANMALRCSAWVEVAKQLCHQPGLHEDYDVAIHLAALGQRVTFDQRLQAAIDFRPAESDWRQFCSYAWTSPRSYALHGLKSRRHMYPVVALVVLCFPLIKLLHRGYQAETKRFSWQQAVMPRSDLARVNPATFVD